MLNACTKVGASRRSVFILAKPLSRGDYQALSYPAAMAFHYWGILASPLTGQELSEAISSDRERNISLGGFWEIGTHDEAVTARDVVTFSISHTYKTPLYMGYYGKTALSDEAITQQGKH